MTNFEIMSIHSEISRKVKTHLNHALSAEVIWGEDFRISSIYDYKQNYCVYFNNSENLNKIKTALKEFGAKYFRKVGKNALCFYFEDGIGLNH